MHRAAAFVACALTLITFAQACDADAENAEGTTTPQAVEFDGQTLILASHAEDDGTTLREYIPAGEELDHWTVLAAIREFPDIDNPRELALRTAAELDRRSPPCPNSVIENPETGEVILDFVIWPEDSAEVEQAPFVEFNVFKYSKTADNGVYCQQYALRAYDDIEEFLRGLRPTRERLVELMANHGLQESDADAEETAEDTAP